MYITSRLNVSSSTALQVGHSLQGSPFSFLCLHAIDFAKIFASAVLPEPNCPWKNVLLEKTPDFCIVFKDFTIVSCP